MKIVILGLGNELLQDDGIGVHAIRRLQAEGVKGAECLEVGTAMLNAVPALEWADVVIAIDAVRSGANPGSVVRLELMDGAEQTASASLHDLGLRSVLGFLPDHERPRAIVIGAEPESIGYGMNLTPTLALALDDVVDAVRSEVCQLVALAP